MTDLRARWLDYLSCLNGRRLEELGDHVHDEIMFNDDPVSRAEYAAAIASNTSVVPDFHWHVEDLVVQGDTVAVRLTDTGTPTGTWLDVPASGASFRISEWALYRYRGDRVAGMHYLLDVPAAREQLGAGR